MRKTYRIYPAKIAPIAIAAVAIYFGVAFSPLAFIAIPFIYLGSICAAPNFNLADGFPILVSMVLGAGIMIFKKEIGFAIFLGSTSSWVLSAIEKAITAIPIDNEKNKAEQVTTENAGK